MGVGTVMLQPVIAVFEQLETVAADRAARRVPAQLIDCTSPVCRFSDVTLFASGIVRPASFLSTSPGGPETTHRPR